MQSSQVSSSKIEGTPTAPEHVIDDKTSSDGTEQITSQKRFEWFKRCSFGPW